MSSKKAISKSGAHPSAARPWGIAARLAGAYAVTTALILLLVMALLYRALSDNLDREDEQYLGEKISMLETLLRTAPTDLAELREEVDRESQHRFYAPVLIRVSSEEGVVAKTSGIESVLPPSAFPDPVPFHDRRLKSRDVTDTHGRPFGVLAVRLRSGVTPYVIQIGLDQSQERDLLARFRRSSWLVLVFGFSCAAILSYVIARRGLRPLDRMSATARAISSEKLDQRVDPIGLPRELASLAETFNDMLRRLEESFGRLSQFSADIAHELRTPINNVHGLAEVAQARARAGEDCEELMGACLDECQRLSRLIENLLFLARADDPKKEVRRERVLLARELETVREFYEPAAEEAGVRLVVRTSDGLVADLDSVLIQRALANLVENALAHTPSGGHVAIAAEKRDGTLFIVVSDTGCGIPAEHLPHIFDRLHRVDASRSKHTGGIGLGLAIVKSIALLHGGQVEAKSETGVGMCITLALPPAPNLPSIGRTGGT